MKVSDIMKKKVKYVQENESITKAISLMEKFNYKELPVLRGNLLLGKISFFDLMGKIKLHGNEKAGNFVTSTPVVNSKKEVKELIKLMKNSGAEFIVVFDKNLSGVVSDYDILKAHLDFFKGKKAGSVIRRIPEFLKPKDSVSKAKRIMESNKIDRLPVVKNGKCIGQVVWADIIRSMGSIEKNGFVGESIDITKKSVSDIIRSNLTITTEDDLKKALKIMLKEQIRGIPVVNLEGEFEGILLRRDLLGMLVKEEKNMDVVFSGEINKNEKERIAGELEKRLKRFSINSARIRVKRIKGNRCEVYMFLPRKGNPISIKKAGKLKTALSEAIKDAEKILSKAQ